MVILGDHGTFSSTLKPHPLQCDTWRLLISRAAAGPLLIWADQSRPPLPLRALHSTPLSQPHPIGLASLAPRRRRTLPHICASSGAKVCIAGSAVFRFVFSFTSSSMPRSSAEKKRAKASAIARGKTTAQEAELASLRASLVETRAQLVACQNVIAWQATHITPVYLGFLY